MKKHLVGVASAILAAVASYFASSGQSESRTDTAYEHLAAAVRDLDERLRQTREELVRLDERERRGEERVIVRARPAPPPGEQPRADLAAQLPAQLKALVRGK